MGEVKYIHFPVTPEQKAFAVEVKNGETWETFIMRLITEEKQRREFNG